MTTFTLPRIDQDSSDQPTGGFGALRTEHGNLPLAALAYRTRVSGLAVSTTILQTFYNAYNECIESTYIFPIEGEQAVVACEMLVGDRVIRADLQERGEARRNYEQAIRNGHRAALLEENRSETFSLKVGNIPPGQAVQVRITTVGGLSVAHGQWTLRLPLVVAPRYTSGMPLPGASVGGGTASDSTTAPDASTVTPPTMLRGFPNPVNLSLEVEIEQSELSGDHWTSTLESSLHSVLFESADPIYRVQLQPGERVDRDFILRGRFDDSAIRSTLDVESSSAGDLEPTFAIHVLPPKCERTAPRDVSFVLDRSGSMSGWKMETAVRGICRLIDTLGAEDRFQVIAFDDRNESPFDSSGSELGWLEASDPNRFKAIKWLGKIRARGGTRMEQALQAGLAPFRSSKNQRGVARSNAVVLVTDGQIVAEDAVLQMLQACPEHARPRLFCLGIDRAVNASVLRRLADASGGTMELVESEKRLDEILKSFAAEIGSPAVTNLTIQHSSDQDLKIAPEGRRDLYFGRAVTLLGRLPRQAATDAALRLTLAGRLADGSSWSIDLESSANPANSKSPLLLPMWGRKRVRELEDRYVQTGEESLKQSIVDCSLESQVLSRFTAYVAVDESEVVSSKDPHQITQPVELPEGWSAIRPLDDSLLIPIRRAADLRAISPSQAKRDAKAVAKKARLRYVNVARKSIDASVIELLPQSIAQENNALPLEANASELTIAVSEPSEELVEKLQFILNRSIRLVVGSASEIRTKINEQYGSLEGESAESLLQEFTDTAIDFCETESDDLCLEAVDDLSLGGLGGFAFSGPPAPSGRMRGARSKSKRSARMEMSRSSQLAVRSTSDEMMKAPAVVWVDNLLQEIVDLDASYVLIEIDGKDVSVRYLVAGQWIDGQTLPRMLAKAALLRLRVLAKVDIGTKDRLVSGEVLGIVGSAKDVRLHFAAEQASASVLIEIGSDSDPAVDAWWDATKAHS